MPSRLLRPPNITSAAATTSGWRSDPWECLSATLLMATVSALHARKIATRQGLNAGEWSILRGKRGSSRDVTIAHSQTQESLRTVALRRLRHIARESTTKERMCSQDLRSCELSLTNRCLTYDGTMLSACVLPPSQAVCARSSTSVARCMILRAVMLTMKNLRSQAQRTRPYGILSRLK